MRVCWSWLGGCCWAVVAPVREAERAEWGFWHSLSCLSLPQLHISMLGDPWQLGDPESPESVALAGVGHHLGAEKGHVVAWEPVQRANAALRARRRF